MSLHNLDKPHLSNIRKKPQGQTPCLLCISPAINHFSIYHTSAVYFIYQVLQKVFLLRKIRKQFTISLLALPLLVMLIILKIMCKIPVLFYFLQNWNNFFSYFQKLIANISLYIRWTAGIVHVIHNLTQENLHLWMYLSLVLQIKNR